MNRMLAPLLVLLLSVVTLPAQDVAAAAKPGLGMNLNGLADWAPELPFVDVMRCSREWITQRRGESWGVGPELALDENGWVKSLEPDCFARTCVLMDTVNHHPGGLYTLLYDGEGTIKISGGTVVEEFPGRMVVEIPPSSEVTWLLVTETNPDNHLRNIRFIMPGFEATYEKEPFHPVFLARWKGMKCLRFMDWMSTNNSKQGKWENRPRIGTFWPGRGGVPLELLIDLANKTKVNPWFCMPHMADDEYVKQFASLVKEKLDPSLKPHIEYSNEVWNSQFAQYKWSLKKAQELGLGEPARPWEGGAIYYTQRSLEIFKIWEQVFGGSQRLARIISWQAACDPVSWTDSLVLAQSGGSSEVDALAIAPYMSFNVTPERLASEQIDKWTVDQVLDHVETVSLPECIGWMEKQKVVADKYGIKLMAYEGGQHLVGVLGAENNDALTALFLEANRNPRMGTLYTKYLDAWSETGGDTMAIFSSIGRWSKHGSWGVAEYFDQQPAASPKYHAVMQRAKKLGQDVTLELPLEK